MSEQYTTVASFYHWVFANSSRAWALIAQTLPNCSLSIAALVPPKPAILIAVEDTLWDHYTDDGKHANLAGTVNEVFAYSTQTILLFIHISKRRMWARSSSIPQSLVN